MKRTLSIIIAILSTSALPIGAQYYSVNYDKETVAAMAAVAEGYYDEQVAAILKHCQAAEVAAAGIFASKFLERKAQTDIGIWSSGTENYYYRRIYNMVAHKIMPQIWTVARMMQESPQTAMYWGSYQMKICDETKNLCIQFESVVTNSTLTFSDITFLELNPKIAALFRLPDIGGVTWKGMLDDLAAVPGNFTVDNLKADLDNLYNMGVSLTTAGLYNGQMGIFSIFQDELMYGKPRQSRGFRSTLTFARLCSSAGARCHATCIQQYGLGLVGQRNLGQIVFLGHLHCKQVEQQHYVLSAVTHRRHLYGYCVEPIIQVLA